MSWPELQGQELAAIRGAFATPLQLQAAFDGAAEAAELIEVFLPGISAESEGSEGRAFGFLGKGKCEEPQAAEERILWPHVGDTAAASGKAQACRGI